MSVDVVGYLRRSYDGGASTSSVMISDTEEHQTSGYKPTSVFAEKKKKKKVDEAQKKLLYWTEIEGCEDCKKYREEMKKAISKDGKEKAKKHFWKPQRQRLELQRICQMMIKKHGWNSKRSMVPQKLSVGLING